MHEVTFREAIREALIEEMESNPLVFILGENIAEQGGVYQVNKGILDKFGKDRVLDMPISESGFVGAAVGAALLGTRPVVDLMFNDFLPLAMDHIVNHAAKMRFMYGGKASVPMVIRTFFGAGTSAGCSHSQSLEAWMVHCPGLKVVMPSTPADAKGLLKASIRDDDPVIFFEHRLLYALKGGVPEGECIVPLGRADVKREGRDVTVVATGLMVHKALEAAIELEKEGIEIEVLDPRSLLPLDCEALIRSVKKTSRLLIVHEACRTGGIGGEIAAIAAKEAFGYLDAPIERVCAPDVPVPFSPPLENYYIPKKEDIVVAVKKIVS
jgi:pyruvate/2-oxoglutarate/acetoin dehydrogenase E1 component